MSEPDNRSDHDSSEALTRLRIAEARMQVAEELRWLIAGLAALVSHFADWHRIILISAIIGAVLLVPYPYQRDYEKQRHLFEEEP